MKPKIYIASCSFGKDSIATILLALEHNEPLDRVVFAEVMYDHSRGISGEIPEHIEWIYSTAIPKLESMGIKIDVVRGKKDYKWFFENEVKKTGKYAGKKYGFPIGGMCVINRDCKMRPINHYYGQFKDYDIVQYVGIAYDEPKRLARLSQKGKITKVSLLQKYRMTEEKAKVKCEEYGLLSPIYETGTRGGCWFCPNCKINSFVEFKQKHKNLWDDLLRLGKTPNLCSYGFKYGKTIEEVDYKINSIISQGKLF
jgi:3'-phosphoadenosine 5'-phosphosulfate sulfotransferase (PAPS reductase)/FAD synthetase